MENVNWLSMAISALIPTLIGFVYYSKPLFGNLWMTSSGMTDEKVKQGNMPLIIGLSVVMSFFLSFFLLNFNNGPGQEGQYDTFKHGAFHGLIIAIIIVMPIVVSKSLYEQKSWKITLVDIGYWVISLALMGGLLDAMNHWPN